MNILRNVTGGGEPLSNQQYKMLKQVRNDIKCMFSILSDKINKLLAFTLAEVLITLGIIGVVSAMTIPNIVVKIRKRQTVAKLQRAVSVITQGFRKSSSEIGPLTDDIVKTQTPEQVYKSYIAPYISSTPCYTYKECGYKYKVPYTQPNGTRNTFQFYSPSNLAFYTKDGFFYAYQTLSGAGNFNGREGATLIIDINGPEFPNRLGIDVFRMDINKDTDWYMYCKDYTKEQINNDCSKKGAGLCCAEKIRRAGWKIESDYPWQ